MTRLLPILTTLSLLAALTACSQDEDKQTAPTNTDSAGAEGEVLEGSISDAMIPLDQLTSTSPSAEIEGEGDGEGAGNSGSGSGAENGSGGNPASSDEAEQGEPSSGDGNMESEAPAPSPPAPQSAPSTPDVAE